MVSEYRWPLTQVSLYKYMHWTCNIVNGHLGQAGGHFHSVVSNPGPGPALLLAYACLQVELAELNTDHLSQLQELFSQHQLHSTVT